MLNEQEIASLEREILKEATSGAWSHAQLAAIHIFCEHCYKAIKEKLERSMSDEAV